MSKQSLLLVDGDTRSLRVLEVSLRKAGFSVTPAVSVGDALDKLDVNAPDLIISETKFATELDGFELRRRLRSTPAWADIPFIFLTAETAIENKIKGLELGVDDYLTKPIYIKEIVTRINILLQKRQRQFLDLKKDGTRFAGRVTDMPVVDVIQTIEVSRKSGVIQFSNGPTRTATIYFRDGRVIDAEAGTLQGEDAVYRLLTWNEGEFEVEFRTVRRRETIATSSQGLLMEGMRRLDEWSRLLEQLPPLTHRFEIDAGELAGRLGEIPDDNNRILRLFDGKRTLLEVIDGSDFGDLECLQAISRLYFEGLLLDLDPGVRSRRDTGKSGPHLLVESPPVTPIEEVVSGPIDVSVLAERMAQEEAALVSRDEADLAPRPSAEQIDDQNILAEEELHGPLSGGYRPSSLRLIDEAVAAAQAIEPSLFDPGELEALGLDLTVPGLDPVAKANEALPGNVEPIAEAKVEPNAEPKVEPKVEPAPLARVTIQKRAPDPRIEAARSLVEKTPGVTNERPGSNGDLREPARPRPKSVPPPLPSLRPMAKVQQDRAATIKPEPVSPREVDEAPLVDAEQPDREHKLPHEPRLGQSPEPTKPDLDDSSGVPTAIDPYVGEEPTDPSRRTFSPRRDDSHRLRMIGSHGRDRAEASGEVRAPAMATTPPAETGEPQRELVTILPRRITREIKIPTPEGDAPAQAKVETSEPVEAPADKSAEAPPPQPAKPAVEPPARPRPQQPKPAFIPGGVVIRSRGPGRLAQALMGIAAILVGITTYTYCKKSRQQRQPVVVVQGDAGTSIVMPTPDASVQAVGFDATEIDTAIAMAPVDAAPRPLDAAVVVHPADAAVVAVHSADAAVAAVHPVDAAVAVRSVDAGASRPDAVRVATDSDAGVDKSKEARALYDKGHTALEDGDPEQALDYLEQSLKLKRAARTYMERARALQRMNRIDEAVASVDEAIALNKTYAPAYEQKGMILWSAQRHAEARPALEKYLDLDPEGHKAEMIRGMLAEQK